MARLVSLIALTVLIVFLGITFYRVIAPFLMPLFLAGVMVVICQPVFRYLIVKTGGRVRIAAALTTLGVTVVGLIPLLLISAAAIQLYAMARNTLGSDEWKTTVASVRQTLEVDHLTKRLLPYLTTEEAAEAGDQTTPKTESESVEEAGRHVDQLQANVEAKLKTALQSMAQRTLGFAEDAAASVPGAAIDFLGSLVVGVVATLMFLIALYYFLADGPTLLAAAETLVPVHGDYQRELRHRFGSVVRAVASSTLLAAVAQGFLTALALWFTGFGHFMVFFVIGTLAAMIPVVGTIPVWGPCVIVLLAKKDWGSAVFLVAVGTLVIGMADNVIRTFVLQSDAKLHPLLAFVSVLGGVQVMGLWGIFVGPIVASCLHALVTIFNTELKEFSKEKFSDTLDSPLQGARPLLVGVPLTPVESAPVVVSPANPSNTTSPEPTGGSRRSKRRAKRRR